MVETRNGSDLTIKQNVWGLTYIDELVQTSLNDDPADLTEQVCESNYYAMQDANYNVLGMADETGILVERYEYTPYGQRQVYTSSGLNDPLCYAPIFTSKPWQIAGTPGIAQPYSLNATGRQGLFHDEEINLIYNRARELHPTLSRFMQRDLLGYPDGMNGYEYVQSNPTFYADSIGFETQISHSNNMTEVVNRNRGIGMRHIYSDRMEYLGTEYFDPNAPDAFIGPAIDGLVARNKRAAADIRDAATAVEIASKTALAMAIVALPGPEDAILSAFAASKVAKIAGDRGWRYCKAIGRWLTKHGDDIPSDEMAQAVREL